MARLSLLAAALLLAAGVACVAAVDGAQQKILSAQDFPSSRPPLFKFRTYADAKQVKCEINGNGVLFMTVEHKALKGVTAGERERLQVSGAPAANLLLPSQGQRQQQADSVHQPCRGRGACLGRQSASHKHSPHRLAHIFHHASAQR
jgi:hypothetical protein